MSPIPTSLPPLPHSFPSQSFEKLPELHPSFFVPRLKDSPQNPIVDTLLHATEKPDLIDQNTDTVGSRGVASLDGDEEVEGSLWVSGSANTTPNRRENRNLSWDTLRTSFPRHAKPPPFLSEQFNDAFDAVRHHVRPRLDDPSLQLRYMLPADLLELLMMNMTGNSSPLYIWDENGEFFASNGTGEGMRVVAIIEGLDEVMSQSVIRRFLMIGTLMRRLDTLVIAAQQQNTNSTVHAFVHSLSTVLVHIRSSLTRKPPFLPARLTTLWLYYANTENLLSALAALCGRMLQKESQVDRYEPTLESPASLLSHIHKHLQRHIECQSPRAIIATVAFILTATSCDYFIGIGESLGIYEASRLPWLRTTTHSRSDHKYASDLLRLEDEVLDQSTVSSIIDDRDETDFPEFFPSELTEALPAARKSLRILQAADPDHPLCSTSVVATCEWVWSAAEVEMLWTHRMPSDKPKYIERPQNQHSVESRDYRSGLGDFAVFDLEPGAHLASSVGSPSGHVAFESFLSTFPDRLPPLTPTLQHLTRVVLNPFVTHTALLSGSLLRLYLTSLQLETHLTLLRSYLLLTSPSFRRRLVDALFSDLDEDQRDDLGSGHGIGLGRGLAERDTWPPGGADLSFCLRTVIVDSFEHRKDEKRSEASENVWKEAEIRLGFALRDLPIGDGRDRWLNPMSIEALDFLYLDYRPPHPLDIVITSDILSKYQRIFTFLLRIFRAETVAIIAFRSSFKSGSPVFEKNPDAQKILARLRLQIHALITSLMTYVFDSAIGGNFDAYMRRISELREDVLSDTFTVHRHRITDVFTLAESHSDLLNHILTACLLRTTQRYAGDMLRDLLEIILQFGTLLLDVGKGQLPEGNAADRLRELDALFQKRMMFFVKSVQTLHVTSQISGENTDSLQHLNRILGESSLGTDIQSPFEVLLTRIDPTGWWRLKLERQGR